MTQMYGWNGSYADLANGWAGFSGATHSVPTPAVWVPVGTRHLRMRPLRKTTSEVLRVFSSFGGGAWTGVCLQTPGHPAQELSQHHHLPSQIREAHIRNLHNYCSSPTPLETLSVTILAPASAPTQIKMPEVQNQPPPVHESPSCQIRELRCFPV